MKNEFVDTETEKCKQYQKQPLMVNGHSIMSIECHPKLVEMISNVVPQAQVIRITVMRCNLGLVDWGGI